MKILAACVMLFSLLPAAFADQEVSLDQAAQKRLSLFFSNFSEADVPNFAQGEVTDAILLNFALGHCRRNLLDKLPKTPDKNHAIVDAERVNAITERFFGARIGTHAAKTSTLAMASGEAYVFSRIDTLFSIDPSTLRARHDLFRLLGRGHRPLRFARDVEKPGRGSGSHRDFRGRDPQDRFGQGPLCPGSLRGQREVRPAGVSRARQGRAAPLALFPRPGDILTCGDNSVCMRGSLANKPCGLPA